MYHFTTFFDKNYISRGLVLYDSLKQNISEFQFFVLCLDQSTFDFFKDNNFSYPEIIPLTLEELEDSDIELKECKDSRSRIEYYFTISPCLPLYLLTKFNLPHICSLDADMLFLSNPAKLFDYLDTVSIVITPHKFSAELSRIENYGKFNVSFQIFKYDEIGLDCLKKWRAQCIAWCGDYIDERTGFYADQKYLDDWPQVYDGKLKVLDDAVSGLAPWNVNNYCLTHHEDIFFSENQRIIFYHFHGFKFFGRKWSTNSLKPYLVKNTVVVKRLYLTYWEKVSDYDEKLNLNQFKSVRGDTHGKKIDQILNSDGVSFRMNSKTIIELNFINLHWIIKLGIRKIYGLFD